MSLSIPVKVKLSNDVGKTFLNDNSLLSVLLFVKIKSEASE
jgi:hypothetical protein